MKLNAKMKTLRQESFLYNRTYIKTKPIKDLARYIFEDRVLLHKTATLHELISQVDRVTAGQEFKVQWYTLDEDYLQINILFNNIYFQFYCKEVLNTLENFLHVDCKLEERKVSEPAKTSTYRSIICARDN